MLGRQLTAYLTILLPSQHDAFHTPLPPTGNPLSWLSCSLGPFDLICFPPLKWHRMAVSSLHFSEMNWLIEKSSELQSYCSVKRQEQGQRNWQQ